MNTILFIACCLLSIGCREKKQPTAKDRIYHEVPDSFHFRDHIDTTANYGSNEVKVRLIISDSGVFFGDSIRKDGIGAGPGKLPCWAMVGKYRIRIYKVEDAAALPPGMTIFGAGDYDQIINIKKP